MLQPLPILPQIRANHLSILIVPLADPVAMHLPIQPLALVFVELSAADSGTGDCVVRELTLVVGAIRVRKAARAVFEAGGELACVD
jgi:hypothetical protein